MSPVAARLSRVQTIHDLATPTVVIDLDALERNVARMAEAARGHGVGLRPHAKTHKTVEIARLQLKAGAVGLTVAKTSEAEVYAEAGFEDMFVAYPVVGADKGRRLLALADRLRLAVGVDSVEGASTLAGVFHAAGRKLDVLLKVDVGLHRVGVAPADAASMARNVADLPGLRLRGLFTHGGQAYGAEDGPGVEAVAQDEGRTMADVASSLRALGLEVETVSVGSTPTARGSMKVAGVTECRPGNYVFNDFSQLSLGVCGLEDCAMTVLATVVSVPGPGRAVVDAGSKVLSSDPLRPRAGGHGLVLGTRSRLARLSEEHGVIAVEPGDPFRVGDRVKVLPNHTCVVSNLRDRLWTARGESVEGSFAVAARGRVE
jgi:D-serine deaminase-like pyridoxal phosphate-dependent protein